MSAGPLRRVFAALVPPPELALELVRRAQEALGGAARELERVPAEHVHLTLAFLGELDAAGCAALERAVARAAAGGAALALEIAGAGGFPSPGAGRVAWAGVRDAPARATPDAPGGPTPDAPGHDQGPLEALRAGLVRELGSEGLTPADVARPFRPHLTLARSRGGRAPALPAAFVGLVLELGWHAREVACIESRLGRPAPERYAVLARHALGVR